MVYYSDAERKLLLIGIENNNMLPTRTIPHFKWNGFSVATRAEMSRKLVLKEYEMISVSHLNVDTLFISQTNKAPHGWRSS